jgi:predicted AlkP superfamily phosphohydrolase/phosphomutase
MKVLIIGLDGFTWKTLDYLKGKLEMKNLEKLRQNSAWGVLESTLPPSTIPAWISFATGTNPGKHNTFGFMRPKSNLNDLAVISSKDIKNKTLAQILNGNEKQSIWINLPGGSPPLTEDIALGSFISDENHLVYPVSLKDIPEIADYRSAPEGSPLGNFKEYLESILDTSERRFTAAKRLFQEDWDCFFVLFSSSDWVQHQAYDIIKKGELGPFEKEIVGIYSKLDEALGWFVGNIDEETYVILMSDHGFESYNYTFSPNDFLGKNGFLKLKQGKYEKITQTTIKSEAIEKKKFEVNIDFLRRFPRIKGFLREGFLKVRKSIPIERFIRIGGRWWIPVEKESQAISFEQGEVHINKKGRYKEGKVNEEEVSEITDKIVELLKKEKSPFTGESPFSDIVRSSDAFSGPFKEQGPDILLKVKDHAFVREASNQDIYNKATTKCHDPYGIFLINGPGVKPGKLPNKSIMDIAPTALHLLGLGVSTYMDGKPILDAFEEDSEVRKREVKYYKEIADSKFSEKMKKLKLGLKKKAD